MAKYKGKFANDYYGGNRWELESPVGPNLTLGYSIDRLSSQCGMYLLHGCYPSRKASHADADAFAHDLRIKFQRKVGKLIATAVHDTPFYHIMNESDSWVRGSIVRNPNSSNYVCAFELDMGKPMKELEEREVV